nr:hypothetical protein [Pseudomonadota bacterium]
MRRIMVAAIGATFLAVPAQASELFGGVLAHDLDTRLTRGGFEDGADLQVGWRGEPIGPLRALGGPSPYVFA